MTSDDASCASTPSVPPLERIEAERLAASLKALADPTRLQLLSLVRESAGGEACQCDLADAFDLTQPTISHHLRILTDAGFLARSKRGAWAWYTITVDRRDTVDRMLPARRGLTLA